MADDQSTENGADEEEEKSFRESVEEIREQREEEHESGADPLEDDPQTLVDVVGALRAGADHLPRAEEQLRRLRVLGAVDESGEMFRII